MKPTVAVIIPTFNSIRTIQRCLNSIRDQVFYGKIDIYISDGGSTDGTLAVAKYLNCIIIHDTSKHPETAKATALKQAEADVYCMMASDNILVDRKYISHMVHSILGSSDLDFSYSKYYQYDKSLDAMSRYFALLGGNDPLAWYLGRNDKSEFKKKTLYNSEFKVTIFNEQDLPVVGDNGFFITKRAKEKIDLENFYHIDAIHDLVKSKKFVKFAVHNNSIIHDTGDSFFKYLRKRYRYTSNLYFKELKNRRYHVVRNYKNIVRFIIYAFSLRSFSWCIRKYKEFKDSCVFIHPFICIGLCFTYGLSFLNRRK